MSRRSLPTPTLLLALLREVLQYGALGLGLVVLVFLMGNLRRHLAELIAVGFGPGDLLLLARCLLGMVTGYVVPIAFLLGVLLSVARMAADRELTALASCGLGMRALVVPLALLGVGVSCLTAVLVGEVENRSRRELRRVASSLAVRATQLEPGRFHRVGDRVLFAGARTAGGDLEGLLIADHSDPARAFTIFAELGRFSVDPRSARFELELERGSIHLEPAPGDPERHQRIEFRAFDYGFDVSPLLSVAEGRLRPYDLSLAKLRRVLARADAGDPLLGRSERNPLRYRLELHRRFAMPLSPLLFALVATPLAARMRGGARSLGVLCAAAIAFAYYVLLEAGEHLALAGVLPAVAASWLANAVFGVAAVALLRQADRMPS